MPRNRIDPKQKQERRKRRTGMIISIFLSFLLILLTSPFILHYVYEGASNVEMTPEGVETIYRAAIGDTPFVSSEEEEEETEEENDNFYENDTNRDTDTTDNSDESMNDNSNNFNNTTDNTDSNSTNNRNSQNNQQNTENSNSSDNNRIYTDGTGVKNQ